MTLLMTFWCALLPLPAMAYVGPGPGLTMLGSVLGVFAAVGFALLVVLAYPLRMLYRKLRGTHKKDGE